MSDNTTTTVATSTPAGENGLIVWTLVVALVFGVLLLAAVIVGFLFFRNKTTSK